MNIEPLTRHAEWVPEIAKWFYAEWKQLYGGKTLHDVENSVRERLNEDRIPCAFVAIENLKVIGTISLKKFDMETRRDLSPWLAGLYVVSSWRGKGIGSKLVSEIERKANELEIHHLYLYTPASETFYKRFGWTLRERTLYNEVMVSVMEKELR